jgi:hypothetical protein
MIFQNFGFNRQAVAAVAPPVSGVVTNGLIAYYDIGNAACWTSGTTLNDLSGNGNSGSLINGAAYSGSNGGVIELNTIGTTTFKYIGVSDNVVSTINANGTNEASIQLWIKLQQVPTLTDPQSGFIQMTAQTNGIGVHYPYPDGNIYINTLKDIRPNQGTPITDLAVWHYTTIRTAPTTNGWDFYINTGQQSIGDGLNSLSLITPIKIGMTGGGNDTMLCGAIGPILIYNRKISDADRAQNASFFASRF